MLYIWNITNEDWYNGLNEKTEENVLEDINILYIKFQRRKMFTFSFMLFDIMYSYNASFYHNPIKAQWQRSPTAQLKNRSKNKNFLNKSKKKNDLYFVYCVPFYK